MKKNFSYLRGKILYKFLQKNNCLGIFLGNVNKSLCWCNQITQFEKDKDLIKFLSQIGGIHSAFIWKDTKEGHDWWLRKSLEFNTFTTRIERILLKKT